MTAVQHFTAGIRQVLSQQQPNLRYLLSRGRELQRKYPGMFVLIADEGKVVEAFAGRAEAWDRLNELPEHLRNGAIVEFIDDPNQAYAI